MGWKGALRSFNAATRRAQREAVRRQKEFQRQHAHDLKMQQRELDALEVQEFENYLDVLRSVHRDCGPPIDWVSFANQPEPVAPAPSCAHERQAAQQLAGYHPGFIDRLFRRVEQRTRELHAQVERGRELDRGENVRAAAAHTEALEAWRDTRELAQRILAGDREAEMAAIEQLDPFSELSDLGSEIVFQASEEGAMVARILVNGEHVIPSHVKSLLQSGKLSVKKMPAGQFFEIYQDYVCSCVLRIGRETFALLPVQSVIVTAEGEILNSATGYVERQPILSVAIPRRTLLGLNFDTIDPSDSLRNFYHRMDFKRTKGFMPIRPVQAPEVGLR
jgi:hypothetical protein